mmetsp:Transcript_39691/g.119264  ORF Transcript_39691/g.119264 Transcript_39691/m.119264 type:complete len:275 (-) Transcript_39691:660-1484(-)
MRSPRGSSHESKFARKRRGSMPRHDWHGSSPPTSCSLPSTRPYPCPSWTKETPRSPASSRLSSIGESWEKGARTSSATMRTSRALPCPRMRWKDGGDAESSREDSPRGISTLGRTGACSHWVALHSDETASLSHLDLIHPARRSDLLMAVFCVMMKFHQLPSTHCLRHRPAALFLREGTSFAASHCRGTCSVSNERGLAGANEEKKEAERRRLRMAPPSPRRSISARNRRRLHLWRTVVRRYRSRIRLVGRPRPRTFVAGRTKDPPRGTQPPCS